MAFKNGDNKIKYFKTNNENPHSFSLCEMSLEMHYKNIIINLNNILSEIKLMISFNLDDSFYDNPFFSSCMGSNIDCYDPKKIYKID